jgi:SAM-dependent methyltransferase
LSSSWDAAAASWPAGPPPLWRLQSDAVNRRLVGRWLPHGLGSVLKTDLFDEFASEGVYPALAERARDVVGIDVSEAVAAAARRRHPALDSRVADVRALPFADASFDAAVSISTLDHFDDVGEVQRALEELARVVRPGGVLVITLDNPLNPLVAIRNLLPASAARRVRQVPWDTGWTCGPRRLRALVSGAGFRVERQTAVLHAPRALVAMAGRRGSPGATRALVAIEALGRLPTRYVTGHFLAALAVRGPARPPKQGPLVSAAR